MYRTYFEEPNAKILYANTLTTRQIAPESIDLIVTSPPYNLDIKYKSSSDRLPYDDYLSFSKQWMRRAYEWLKPDGRMCLNVPLDKNKGGHQSVGADITSIAKKVGFQYHSNSNSSGRFCTAVKLSFTKSTLKLSVSAFTGWSSSISLMS